MGMELAVVDDRNIIFCTQGESPSALNVTSQSSNRVDGASVATIQDKEPGTNVKPFGTCRIKELLGLKGEAALCQPVTPDPWLPGQSSVLMSVSCFPILTQDSFLKCSIGGVILIATAGQSVYKVNSDSELVFDESTGQLLGYGIHSRLLNAWIDLDGNLKAAGGYVNPWEYEPAEWVKTIDDLLTSGADFLPHYGTLIGFFEALGGRDLDTNEKLSLWERALGLSPALRKAARIGGSPIRDAIRRFAAKGGAERGAKEGGEDAAVKLAKEALKKAAEKDDKDYHDEEYGERDFAEVAAKYPGRGDRAGWKDVNDLKHTWDRHKAGSTSMEDVKDFVPEEARAPGTALPPTEQPTSKFPPDWDLNKIARAADEVANSKKFIRHKPKGDRINVDGTFDGLEVRVQVSLSDKRIRSVYPK